ncbi:glycosyl transferase family 1, partial [Mycobacterium sp. IS-836]|uniref:glycosyltransferase n=1 Tax=Mycobacterium sp. IS-836 TaxID=1834160 RepID=UPI00096EE4AF
VGRELLRRGHDVHVAVAPDLVEFVESAGLRATEFGPDARLWQDVHRDLLTRLFRSFWKVRELSALVREDQRLFNQLWEEIGKTLMSLAEGADLVLTSAIGEQSAANIAEYYGIPLATLHTFPIRANGQLIPGLPAPVGRSAMTVSEWMSWPMLKKRDDAQRRELGLPKAAGLWSRRIAERASLEIQAYDEVCFPGLAAEWANCNGQRPFVGALTMELATDADEEVASWIAAGTPPIFFGFGSTPVKSPADTVAMIGAACAQLGERALICSGWSDFGNVPHSDHVKVVEAVNYAAVFPACRAVVHHGGMGTIAAGLRAGVPMLILWTAPDQAIWASHVKRLKVGSGRRFTSTSRESLAADLHRILGPDYVSRAR